MAAAITACLLLVSVCVDISGARAANLSVCSYCWRSNRKECNVYRFSAVSAWVWLQVSCAEMGAMLIQSTGQGGTHSAQPVHCSEITVCICLALPKILSTGQASRHSVQPMQLLSSMTANCRGPSVPKSGLRSSTWRCSCLANRAIPCAPPGGHWLISAWPCAIACA
jgi:hypothetical protein